MVKNSPKNYLTDEEIEARMNEDEEEEEAPETSTSTETITPATVQPATAYQPAAAFAQPASAPVQQVAVATQSQAGNVSR